MRTRLSRMAQAIFVGLFVLFGSLQNVCYAQMANGYEYLLLATNRTSTMQKEMQEAANLGYAFTGVMGGETTYGGSEVVVVMKRSQEAAARFEYRLLATTKTSTMQDELQAAGNSGFIYKGQTVFETTFGGVEAVGILERDKQAIRTDMFEYRLLATKRTSTMQ